MQSSGGLAAAELAARHAAFTVLSGPAGGAAAAALVARDSGRPDLVCFDMGGTSCDVCVVEGGAVRETAGREVGGRPLALPMVDIHTVGAGGGSVAWRDPGGALRVGPRSAGADPGPACYGRGGEEPTVTDANLLLGRLDPERRAGGRRRARPRGRAARRRGGSREQLDLDPIACAEGIVRVANAEMVRALRVMTVQQGIDPRRFALLAFGGAGPLHAAAIADELGMTTILCPRASGVLSALGLAAADRRATEQRTVLLAGDALTDEALATARDELADGARATLGQRAGRQRAAPATPPADRTSRDRPPLATASCGSRSPTTCATAARRTSSPCATSPQPAVAELRAAFEDLHEERYGYRDDDAPIEVVTIRATASVAGPQLDLAAGDSAGSERSRRAVVFDGEEHDAEILRGEPAPGERIDGPAICELPEATLAVPPGWHGTVDDAGTIVLERERLGAAGRANRRADEHRRPRPDRPAGRHRRAARRLRGDGRDARAQRALGEHQGAPRLLDGALRPRGRDGHAGRAHPRPPRRDARRRRRRARRGPRAKAGPWILNDPYRGGTHLPDITVVTPVLHDGALLGFAASRAHHADVGGRTPGSMPADSTTLDEEGVVIAPRPLDDAAIDELVAQMRQPEQRRADLRAQLAANRTGARRLVELAERLGAAGAARRPPTRCSTTPSGARAPASPRSTTARARRATCSRPARAISSCASPRPSKATALTLDFSGSAAQHEGNLNCPLAVTRSAAYFAVRVLTDPDVPPSAGAYRPITVLAPEGSLLNARSPAAVAGGNVETSSRVADLVLAAFGRALGQGTMNNLTLGTETFTYYETLGGGQGACPDADGPSGVHVAMSNTLNTPVEALELEFPLRVARYEIRRGSGGAGAHRGGDGVVRELEALAPMSYSLITERRRHAPPGAAGGEPGARGRNLLNGRELPAKASGELAAGDRLDDRDPRRRRPRPRPAR